MKTWNESLLFQKFCEKERNNSAHYDEDIMALNEAKLRGICLVDSTEDLLIRVQKLKNEQKFDKAIELIKRTWRSGIDDPEIHSLCNGELECIHADICNLAVDDPKNEQIGICFDLMVDLGIVGIQLMYLAAIYFFETGQIKRAKELICQFCKAWPNYKNISELADEIEIKLKEELV